MTKPVKYKKIRKLLNDPNMFFYDMFRKRVFKDAPKTTLVKTSAEKTVSAPVDIVELQRLGVVEYLRKYLRAVTGPEDGQDPNSLLIWNGYANALVTFIGGLKTALSMDVSIYTLGGGYSISLKADEKFDVNAITSNLNRRPDFVVEMSNLMGEMYILHIYLFDLAPTGIVTVRSSKAWVRKFPLEQIERIFQANTSRKNASIDAVYTWVNHADVDWQSYWIETFPEEEFDPDRYTSNDELRYSLRSLNKYAPWLNKIYIVSNCSKPTWLNEVEKIVWVKHEEIFPDISVLPTFNSHAIEACLHRVPGLSEQFLYLNDDFILSQPCLPSDFFDEIGRSLAYFESYGMVDNCGLDAEAEEPDYLKAAKNSKALIQKVDACYDARNLHRHVPYALRKSFLFELEQQFEEAFSATRQAKRRAATDVNVTSFLYHHFAYIKGVAVKGDALGLIVRPGNAKHLADKDSYKYKILCFNDGDGSSEDKNYKIHTQAFFDKRLPERAPWEFAGG